MINQKWDIILKDEMQKEYFKQLGIFVKQEYKSKVVFPPYENIFDALRFTDYDEVKVVIFNMAFKQNANTMEYRNTKLLLKIKDGCLE